MLQARATYDYKHPQLDDFISNEVKIKLYTQEAHFSIKNLDEQLLYYKIVRFDFPISHDAFLYYLHKWIALDGIKFSSLWLVDFQSKFILLPNGVDNMAPQNYELQPHTSINISNQIRLSIPDYNLLWQSTREKFQLKTNHFLELEFPFCESLSNKTEHWVLIEVMPDSFCFLHYDREELRNIVYQPQCSTTDIIYFLMQYCQLNGVPPDKLDLYITGIIHPNGPIEEALKGFFPLPKLIVNPSMNEFALLDVVFQQELS